MADDMKHAEQIAGPSVERGSRRSYLKRVSTGLSILVVGGATYRTYDQGVMHAGTGPAYEPWDDWQDHDEGGPLSVVRAAILAASPHNSQPWRFDVHESSVDLFSDPSRTLGSFDAFRREFDIGLGCALENGMLAARANGFVPDVTMFPDDSDHTHIATLDLHPAAPDVSPLYEAIPDRHTNRAAYNTDRKVAPATRTEMTVLADEFTDIDLTWVTELEPKHRLSEMLVEATASIISDDEMINDSSEWFRYDWDEIQTKRDGVTVDAQGLSAFRRILGKMLPAPSDEWTNRLWLDATEEQHTETADSYGLLTVGDANDRSQLLRAGRLWQRLHLFGTTRSLAMHPMNQITEWIDRQLDLGNESVHEDQLRAFTPNEKRLVFTFRIGHPTKDGQEGPRRSVEMVRQDG
ncbi:Acg family FMN-binding oxidoreductase [Haloferax sp. DFSO60]|uniref:Acg family FMN-binding oxidoreductase n=1 Tax=Haloferax sp. DFSO60 TaxID=3388652 RepID=UPI00397C0879